MSVTAVRAEARAFAAAVTLLTRFPLGARVRVDETDLARSLAWLPLVGTALGGALALAARGLEGRLVDGAAAVLLVAAWALATGAIHLDGLADSADALGGGDRERRLAIMRDSRLGSFGVLALVLVLALKIALVAAVLARGHHLWLIAIPAVGRVAASALSAVFPYARDQGGTGAALVSGGRRFERLSVAFATALVVALACARLRGLLAVAAATLVALAIGRLAVRRLGGVTGDVLGASIELAECAALLALLAGR
jgi:adenosylcobinamide-GDP ribazoletransferase